jgi:NAD(P)-dependent dehydrogenase (short-subunit alcohol dehydrogenase family)
VTTLRGPEHTVTMRTAEERGAPTLRFKTRLKAALTAFTDPDALKRAVIHVREPEPRTVLDNRLMAGRNVLITGAGRNIGRSIALEMAKQGANVFFTDLKPDSCETLQQELNGYEVTSRGFVSDVSKIEDVDGLFAALSRQNVAIDTLVHNAGVHYNTVGIRKLDLAEWRATFETNVFGPLHLTKLIANSMVGSRIKGCIVFLSSIHQWTIRSLPSYSASKAALGMVIKELAAEMAAFGIRVNGIAPGLVAEDGERGPKYYEHAPLHMSSISPQYIGRAAVYLASSYFSEFTTGTLLKIDDGLSLYNHYSDNYSPS